MQRRWIGLAALLVTGSADAASFDCLQTHTADERAVCRYRALNDRDVKMTTLYTLDLHLVPMGGGAAIRDDQAAWLKRRRACRANIACLTRSYDRRIATLQAVIDTRVYPHGPF